MKTWINKYFGFLSVIIAALAFWIFGDIILFLAIIAVIAAFPILKGVYKMQFYYLEIIILVFYLILAFICLLFPELIILKILVIILGIWFVFSLFIQKRF